VSPGRRPPSVQAMEEQKQHPRLELGPRQISQLFLLCIPVLVLVLVLVSRRHQHTNTVHPRASRGATTRVRMLPLHVSLVFHCAKMDAPSLASPVFFLLTCRGLRCFLSVLSAIATFGPRKRCDATDRRKFDARCCLGVVNLISYPGRCILSNTPAIMIGERTSLSRCAKPRRILSPMAVPLAGSRSSRGGRGVRCVTEHARCAKYRCAHA
jgi:hypothetical protein